MKYILLMTGTRAGVESYRTWPKSDVEAHFRFLAKLSKELTESGEFVANEGLGSPEQAKVVKAVLLEKALLPAGMVGPTDGELRWFLDASAAGLLPRPEARVPA